MKNPHDVIVHPLITEKTVATMERDNAVSYTHLTLPTIYTVEISVVAGSIKKKTTHKLLMPRCETEPTG